MALEGHLNFLFLEDEMILYHIDPGTLNSVIFDVYLMTCFFVCVFCFI